MWGGAISKLEADFFNNQHFIFNSVLKIYTYPVLLRLPNGDTCLSNGRTKWHWSINSETLDNCWSDESFLLVNQWHWVTAGKKQCHCVPQCVLLFPL